MATSSSAFFDAPILNGPYECPARHWELDDEGQPTHRELPSRRPARFITPVPLPQKRKGGAAQKGFVFDEGKGLSTETQQYETTSMINEVRSHVSAWRSLPNPNSWQVTPETARLLQHWRHHAFNQIRPFFCQVEAMETAIWLTEVAPQFSGGKKFIEHLARANANANPGLSRLALKLATGAGKTTVMAMLIAWQTINAVRRPDSKRFTSGFLVVAPGITIRDRLQVLRPSDLNSYYQSRELVPLDMLNEVRRAKIVITNFHGFMPRERLELSKGGRSLLQGRGPELSTVESEGQMIARVLPELMGMKNIIVLNDEGHHCYRQKPKTPDEIAAGDLAEMGDPIGDLKGDERKEAEKNNEAARVWISGIEAVARKLGVARVFDLSATPFFLRGSGYGEGTLFPWTMSDFSLMDAIECGIVKLPRVPVADNVPGSDMPMYRNLWEHIRGEMPKAGRSKQAAVGPPVVPVKLQTALEALYGHYKKAFRLWQDAEIDVPPCFIVVCQNTSISKLVYDYVAGVRRQPAAGEAGHAFIHKGALPLFRNYDENGNPLPSPRTILIDSEQLESGEALDSDFRAFHGDALEQFRRERVERSGNQERAEDFSDQEILREVMNTVGRAGKLGGRIRCVVSVSMLTEGWDANTVTHVLGVRAFGTQLLCEQVIGRALRRQSYDLNDQGLFNVEYADVFGIPFDFTAQPVVAEPQKPRELVHVHAVSPERDALTIRFPRLVGYRVELPKDRLTALFTDESVLELTPELTGATETRNSGIIGQSAEMTLEGLGTVRRARIVYKLAAHLVMNHYRDGNGEPELHLFGQLKRIAAQWLDEGHCKCIGGTKEAQLLYTGIADKACNRIKAAIDRGHEGTSHISAVLDPNNPGMGTTAGVSFTTSKTFRWKTDPRLCHLNLAILDSEWEAEFCRVVEKNKRVVAYVKNHNLAFEVPYRSGSEAHRYRPDFIVKIDDGGGPGNLLNLVVEIKGYRGEDAKEKRETMDTYWVPAVNNARNKELGRWAFAELTEVFKIGSDFGSRVEEAFDQMLDDVTARRVAHAMGQAHGTK